MERGEPAVLVTVASVRGSTPREPGAKMVVTGDAFEGTIGGGHLELKAIEIARDLLASGEPGELRRFPLGASLGQCCGGLVNLLFEPVAGSADWLRVVAQCDADQSDAIVVTQAGARGAAGKMVVTRDRVHGGFADAALERRAVEKSRALLEQGEDAHMRALGESGALVLFDPLHAPDLRIVLFGAGHVGRALVRALEGIDCRITWVDSRDEQFPAQVPENVRVVCTDDPEAVVDAAAAAGCFLVMTHSHALDLELAIRILGRGDFRYFGLIGSATKRRLFEKRMLARGIAARRLESMTCPIGVAGIGGKQPAAIAVAVAAQLLQVQGGHPAASVLPGDAPLARRDSR
jgi:xanthine dehydrogenase accessory factor